MAVVEKLHCSVISLIIQEEQGIQCMSSQIIIKMLFEIRIMQK